MSTTISHGRVLRQTKPRPWGAEPAEKVQWAAGVLKKGQGLGQGAARADAALTGAAKAESEHDRKDTDGKAGL